jgi:hypothetical protein
MHPGRLGVTDRRIRIIDSELLADICDLLETAQHRDLNHAPFSIQTSGQADHGGYRLKSFRLRGLDAVGIDR